MLWPRNFKAVSPEVKGRTVYSFFSVDNIEFNMIGSSSTVRMTGIAAFSDTTISSPKPTPSGGEDAPKATPRHGRENRRRGRFRGGRERHKPPAKFPASPADGIGGPLPDFQSGRRSDKSAIHTLAT
jgi:hypothetical protein